MPWRRKLLLEFRVERKVRRHQQSSEERKSHLNLNYEAFTPGRQYCCSFAPIRPSHMCRTAFLPTLYRVGMNAAAPQLSSFRAIHFRSPGAQAAGVSAGITPANSGK